MSNRTNYVHICTSKRLLQDYFSIAVPTKAEIRLVKLLDYEAVQTMVIHVLAMVRQSTLLNTWCRNIHELVS